MKWNFVIFLINLIIFLFEEEFDERWNRIVGKYSILHANFEEF